MQPRRVSIELPDPTATSDLARRIGADLGPGDVVLLEGGIGAGKTHFARSLIQSRLTAPEDVPSPTFTLVQIYDSPAGEIWHSDLYRLDHVDSVVELGLLEAFETAICLVEWPDRLGDLAPMGALRLAFSDGPDDDARQLVATWTAPRWDTLLTDEAA
ncbi:tRNA threonylcarbamoyladenosine biosynthesis protein TsaE [Roseivivax lentus]|uniref:tRNA threonylcarbamoyladenosine biosynthesis protein TsaE n=1 Tax=Roseivivax lentus TaxID=633194 RepID=A0A1N7JSU8_9RHOB|nr:tRNA (adenosine(37)-N6)-threonylcarbamoyltransferase complex ATPase subunit type 1 TsaE [Roseivivax lentus]SIS52422.1 tRNA threonylcarbamoyladenosine biosynthesis protein TsaE [Roseivivax lentus]